MSKTRLLVSTAELMSCLFGRWHGSRAAGDSRPFIARVRWLISSTSGYAIPVRAPRRILTFHDGGEGQSSTTLFSAV